MYKTILLSSTAFGTVYLFVTSLKMLNEYTKKFDKEYIPLPNRFNLVYNKILLLLNGTMLLLSGGYFGYLFYKTIQTTSSN